MTEKVFCDKCKKEITDQNRVVEISWSYYGPESHLCDKCEKALQKWLELEDLEE